MGTIELQECMGCPSGHEAHWIGPDPRDIGLFNYDNRLLFSHELLDDYTSAFTTSETPFVAWVSVVSRRYSVHDSERPFVSDDKFRDVWFAYTKLQNLEGDMECPDCGPNPEDVIFDGITLGFQKKFVRSTLRPPTILHPDSIQRDKARYVPGQQLLREASLRRNTRKALRGPHAVDDLLEDEYLLDQADDDSARAVAVRASAALAHISLLEEVCQDMKMVCEPLAALFEQHFGVLAYTAGSGSPPVIAELFAQVCFLRIQLT